MERKKVHVKRKLRRRKVCPFRKDKVTFIDYKDIDTLLRYVSERGKITPKRNSGVSSKFQRMLAISIKRARYMGLLPFCKD